MKKIVVASKNPVKISAALAAFRKIFPSEIFEAEGVSVPSGVSDQPKSDRETFEGAKNRATNASVAHPTADFWVGMEGGVEEGSGTMGSFAWMVVKAKSGAFGKGRTSTFFLPPRVAELIKQGKELGEADDIVFGGTNTKQKNGAVGLLTGDAVTRTSYYTEALILSLIPFKNEHLYPNDVV
mgnify:CR=1 FL=1